MIKIDKILGILVCPKCKKSFNYDSDRKRLCCSCCKKKYRLENGVPILLTNEAEIEINMDRDTKAGMEMFNEFSKEGLLDKVYDYGKKIISSDFNFSKYLKKIKTKLLDKELILEIGAGNRKLSDKVINYDIFCFKHTDVAGDAHDLPFIDGIFDVVWIEMVLEHVRDPKKVVAEIYRVLKPGGYVYSMTPFIMPFHSYPGDYQRFTLQGLDELFKQYKKEDSGVYKGPSVAMVNNLSDYFALFSFSNNRMLYIVLKALFLCFLFPLKYFDMILVKNGEAHKLSNALFYLGRK